MDVVYYLSLVVDERDAQIRHGSEDGHKGLDGVAVDDRSVLFEIVRREPTLVNDSNLEDENPISIINSLSYSFSFIVGVLTSSVSRWSIYPILRPL